MKPLTRTMIVFLILFGCGRDFDNPVDSIVYLGTPRPFTLSQYRDGILVQWTKESRFVTGYQIERKSGSVPYLKIAEVTDTGAESYMDTTVTTGIEYQYRVCGLADENKSGYTGSQSVKAEFNAPTDLVILPLTLTSLRLTWRDNCVFEDGFIIERKQGTSGAWTVLGQTGMNMTTYTDEGLVYNLNYDYRIKAFTRRNQSDYSPPKTAKIVINAPNNLTVSPLSDHEMRLRWKDNSTFDDGVKVERMENDNYQWHPVGTAAQNFSQFIDDSLRTNVKYTYRVKAFAGIFESVYSDYAEALVTFPKPGNLRAETVSQFSARLRWDDGYNFETGFVVKYVREGSMDTVAINLPVNTTQYLIDDINKNDQFIVCVFAYTDFNQSERALKTLSYSEQFRLERKFDQNGLMVEDLEFNPAGTQLAAVSDMNEARLYQSDPWNRLRDVAGDTTAFPDGVKGLSFARHQPWLALGNLHGAVRVVNTNTWNEVSRLYLNSYALSSCAFSGDDAFIAAAQYKFIYIWETSGWSFSKNIEAHTDDITTMDFSPNENWLATGGKDDVIKIWSANDWSEITTLTGHSGDISCVRFSPDSKWLATGSEDGSVQIWSTADWSALETLTGFSDYGSVCDFSRDGQWLAVGDKSPAGIRIYSTSTWEWTKTLTEVESEVWSLCFSPVANTLAAGNFEGQVFIWDTQGAWTLD